MSLELLVMPKRARLLSVGELYDCLRVQHDRKLFGVIDRLRIIKMVEGVVDEPAREEALSSEASYFFQITGQAKCRLVLNVRCVLEEGNDMINEYIDELGGGLFQSEKESIRSNWGYSHGVLYSIESYPERSDEDIFLFFRVPISLARHTSGYVACWGLRTFGIRKSIWTPTEFIREYPWVLNPT